MLDTLRMNGRGGFRSADNLLHKCALAAIAFHEMDLQIPQNGQDQARKAGAGTQISHDRRRWDRSGDVTVAISLALFKDQGMQLRRIKKMSTPRILQRLRADQIDRSLPFLEQGEVSTQTVPCFT